MRKTYENEKVKVLWQPDVCIHAAECVKGSPNVFNPKNKPWIEIENGESDQLMSTIDKCPSGALSYRKK